MAQNLAMPTCECELLRAHIRALEKENDCLRERLALYQKKTSPGGQEKGERLALYQKLSDPVSGRKSTTSPATIAPLPQTGTGAGLPALPPPPSAADLHKEVVVSHFRDNTVTVTGPEERVVKPKHNEPLPTDAQKELHFQSNQNGCNLFVFHIPGEWREEDLQRHFRPFGTIVSAIIARETQTGRNKGFGFVCYESPLDALKAISEMNGASVAGKRLSVQLKRTTLRKGEEDEKKAAATPAPAPPAPKGGTVTADQRGCTRILTVSPAVHSQHLQMHKQYAVPPATVDGGDGGAEKKQKKKNGLKEVSSKTADVVNSSDGWLLPIPSPPPGYPVPPAEYKQQQQQKCVAPPPPASRFHMQPADSCFESHPQILKAPLMSTPPAHVPALPPTSSTCSSNEPIPSCTSLEAYPPPERPVVPPPTRHAPQTVSPLSGVSTDEGEPSMTVETVLEHWGPGPQTQQAPPPAAAGAGPAHHQQQQEFLFPRGAGLWGSAAAAAPCGVWGNTATMVVTEARDSESVDPFLA